MPVIARALEAASSLRLLVLLFALWCVGLLASPFYIAPTSDDGALTATTLGFIHFGSVSMQYIDHSTIYSAAFPGSLFIAGIFYWLWDAIGLPINFYVYNAFHNLVVVGMLAAFVALFFATARNRREGALRSNICLGLLAVSPFVLDLGHLRPEPMGFVAIIGAILAFHSAGQVRGFAMPRRADTVLYLFSALLLGLAVTMHPYLVVTAGLTALAALVQLLRRGDSRTSVWAVLAGLTPPLLAVAWYLANFPESVDMLFYEINKRGAGIEGIGKSMMDVVGYITMARPADVSIVIKLYQAGLYWTLVLCVLSALVMLAVRFKKQGTFTVPAFGDAEILCTTFFLAALANAFIDPSGRTQLFIVLSCAAILMLGMLLRHPAVTLDTPSVVPYGQRGALTYVVSGALVFAVLFNPLVHISKRWIFSEPRYHGLTAIEKVRPMLVDGDALFITGDQFLPPFVDLFMNTYGGKASIEAPKIEAHWILPYMHGRPGLDRRAVSALICFLAQRRGERLVWGVRRNLISFGDDKRRLATIQLVTRHRGFRIEFEVDDILYEFHDGYFVAGRILGLTETTDNEARATNAVLYRHPDYAPGCLNPGVPKDGAGSHK